MKSVLIAVLVLFGAGAQAQEVVGYTQMEINNGQALIRFDGEPGNIILEFLNFPYQSNPAMATAQGKIGAQITCSTHYLISSVHTQPFPKRLCELTIDLATGMLAPTTTFSVIDPLSFDEISSPLTSAVSVQTLKSGSKEYRTVVLRGRFAQQIIEQKIPLQQTFGDPNKKGYLEIFKLGNLTCSSQIVEVPMRAGKRLGIAYRCYVSFDRKGNVVDVPVFNSKGQLLTEIIEAVE